MVRMFSVFLDFFFRAVAIDSNTAYALILREYSDCPYLTNYKTELEKYIDDRNEIVAEDLKPIFISIYQSVCSSYLDAVHEIFQNRKYLTPVAYFSYKGIPEEKKSTFAHTMQDKSAWDNLRYEISYFAGSSYVRQSLVIAKKIYIMTQKTEVA